jgi:hypothetical protein
MKKMIFGLMVAAVALATSAFTTHKEMKVRQSSYVYFNTSNQPLPSNPTTADLAKLHYTGQNPADVCASGSTRCMARYTAPSTPAIGASPISTANFVSIDPATKLYNP